MNYLENIQVVLVHFPADVVWSLWIDSTPDPASGKKKESGLILEVGPVPQCEGSVDYKGRVLTAEEGSQCKYGVKIIVLYIHNKWFFAESSLKSWI